ncbi:hypothetical protein [Psychromonas hadalis]|uniref:hypothetical protein n=1 Tax=Psychromonas hadalis TaxID=211669 RepID=UPI0003B7326E|nr:hypothetical protein [Psychromonas hadalis]
MKISVLLIGLFLLSACGEDKKTEQVIIPSVQLEALEKAKNIEAELLKAQQKRDEKYKKQGL